MPDVYLDHNATTPLDPRVREAMLPWLGERFGNPSSVHGRGRAARKAVEEARRRVAELIGAAPGEVVFTASGTEANNAVLMGAVRRRVRRSRGDPSSAGPGRLVLSSMEHPSLRVAAAHLADTVGVGAPEIVLVPPEPDGRVGVEEMRGEIDADALLVALMLANNELGTLQPVAEVARTCRKRRVPVLTDAVQAVGKVPVDARELGVDYLVLGAHKFYGPLGAAALWVRDGAPFEPLLVGGGQERGRRASTENVAALVGLGEAARIASEDLAGRVERMRRLRDRFEERLRREIPGAVVHCADSPRLPQTSHVAVPGVEGESLLLRLDLAGYAVSTGSACSAGKPEPSPTLVAMGVEPREALGSIRVSFGPSNTEGDVDGFVQVLAREVKTLRSLTG